MSQLTISNKHDNKMGWNFQSPQQEGNPLTSRDEKKRDLFSENVMNHTKNISESFVNIMQEVIMESFQKPDTENKHGTFHTTKPRLESFRKPDENQHGTFRTNLSSFFCQFCRPKRRRKRRCIFFFLA